MPQATTNICNQAAATVAVDYCALVTQVEQLALGCVNGGDPTCDSVVTLARQEIAFADACALGQNPTCAGVKTLVLGLAGQVVQIGTACASLRDSVCGPLVHLAEQEAAVVEAIATSCAQGRDATCNTVTDLAQSVAAQGLACAQGGTPTCDAAKVLVLQLVGTGVATVTACASLRDTTCGPTVRLVEAEAAAVEALATSCAQGTNAECNLVLNLAKAEAAAVLACATGGYTLCDSTKATLLQLVASGEAIVLACAAMHDATCGPAVRTVTGTVNSAVAAAQQCANGQNATCAEAETAAAVIVAGLTQCAIGGGPGPVPTTGLTFNTQLALDVYGACVQARDLAVSVIFGGVLTVQGCAQMTDATCGPTIRTAENTAQQIVAFAQACAAGSDATCRTVLDALAGAVLVVGQCVSQFASLSASTTAAAPAADIPAACGTAKMLIDSAVATVVQKATQCVGLQDDTCGQGVQLAKETLNSVVALAQACVSGADPTCKSLLDSAKSLVDSAARCVGSFVPVAVGPPTGAEPAICTTADGLVAGALVTVAACVGLHDGTCGPTVTAVEQVVGAVVAVGSACEAGVANDNGTVCATARQALTGAVTNCINGNACTVLAQQLLDLALTSDGQTDRVSGVTDGPQQTVERTTGSLGLPGWVLHPPLVDLVGLDDGDPDGYGISSEYDTLPIDTTGTLLGGKKPPSDQYDITHMFSNRSGNATLPYRKGYWYGSTKGFGRTKVEKKHGVTNVTFLQDMLNHGVRKNDRGRQVYRAEIEDTQTHDTTVFRLVMEEEESPPDHYYPVGVITAYCETGKERCPDWFYDSPYNGPH